MAKFPQAACPMPPPFSMGPSPNSIMGPAFQPQPLNNLYSQNFRFPLSITPMFSGIPIPQYMIPTPPIGAGPNQLQPTVPTMPTPGTSYRPEETKRPPADGSLDSSDDSPKNKSLLSGKAYKSRNVYKSIIRHLFSYIRKNREDIIRILTEAGFPMSDIEHGFFKVNYYNDLERDQSSKKNSQSIIKKMVAKRTIYTYILRETLNTMLHNWTLGKYGKVSEGNSDVYRDVCQYFYDECAKMLGQPAQGKTFLL